MNEQAESPVDEKNTVTTQEESKVLTTEVTSLAKEDARNGTTTKLPSPEELVQRANVSFIQKRQMLAAIWPKLSKKATLRVLAAGLDLPAEDLPVVLRTDDEKMCFGLLQRIQQDRFLIIQNEINKQMLELKAKKQAELSQQQEGV